MAQQCFSTGPGSWGRAARNESTVGLDRTAKGSLLKSEMVRGITIRISRGTDRTVECIDRNCSQTVVEQM